MFRLLTVSLGIAGSLLAWQASAELRDPTRPSGYAQDLRLSDEPQYHSDMLQLQAIFFNPGNPAVLINGKRYAVDEQVGDSTVKSIYADRVILLGQSGEIELKLAVPSVKKRHGDQRVKFPEGKN